jgi:hypothetical protein
MTKNSGERPPKYIPLPFSDSGYAEDGTDGLIGVHKFFEDPDFARIRIRDDEHPFDISWATDKTAPESLDVLEEFIESSQLKTGSIVLRHTFERPGTIMGGANLLEGELEDIVNEVYDSQERAVNFTLYGPDFDLWWSHSWPMTFHEIPTNEILLRFNREQSVSRYAIDHCMSLTAMPGLRSTIDITLDEFAVYQPELKS